MMKTALASFKVFLFALNCIWVIPLQSLVLLFTKGPLAYQLPWVWQNLACMIFGIKVVVNGTPYKDSQTLYMCNHLSYMDIPAIASVLKAPFVAKSDVETWPLFGFLSTLQQTAFIQRKRSAAGKQKNALLERIEKGDSLIIFPEGTSTSGLDVLPFKSSLFSLAQMKEGLYVQPMTIQVLDVNGHPPTTKEEIDIYAWPRDMDMELPEHIWRFAKTSGATLSITFHPPLKASEYENRKVLAKLCHDTVSKGLGVQNAA